MYINNILIIEDSVVVLNTLIQKLQHEFSVKDFGDFSFFLGIKVQRTKHGLFLNQYKYIWDLSKQVGMTNAKMYSTPMSVTLPLTKSDGQPLKDGSMYQKIVGAL